MFLIRTNYALLIALTTFMLSLSCMIADTQNSNIPSLYILAAQCIAKKFVENVNPHDPLAAEPALQELEKNYPFGKGKGEKNLFEIIRPVLEENLQQTWMISSKAEGHIEKYICNNNILAWIDPRTEKSVSYISLDAPLRVHTQLTSGVNDLLKLVAVAPHKPYIAVASNNAIIIYNTINDSKVIYNHNQPITAIAFSPCDQLGIGYSDGFCTVSKTSDLTKFAEVTEIVNPRFDQAVTSLVFSSDNQYIFATNIKSQLLVSALHNDENKNVRVFEYMDAIVACPSTPHMLVRSSRDNFHAIILSSDFLKADIPNKNIGNYFRKVLYITPDTRIVGLDTNNNLSILSNLQGVVDRFVMPDRFKAHFASCTPDNQLFPLFINYALERAVDGQDLPCTLFMVPKKSSNKELLFKLAVRKALMKHDIKALELLQDHQLIPTFDAHTQAIMRKYIEQTKAEEESKNNAMRLLDNS